MLIVRALPTLLALTSAVASAQAPPPAAPSRTEALSAQSLPPLYRRRGSPHPGHLHHPRPQRTLHRQGPDRLPGALTQRLRTHPQDRQPHRPPKLRPHLQRASRTPRPRQRSRAQAHLRPHLRSQYTRLSTFLNPRTHIAQDIILKRPPSAPANAIPQPITRKDPLLKEEELGEQPLGPVTLRGIRRSRTVPAAASGTGKDVLIVDEYWYSPDLSIYMIIKHNDPRTGEQIVAVSEVERGEPDGAQFLVPATYKRVDETPIDQAP